MVVTGILPGAAGGWVPLRNVTSVTGLCGAPRLWRRVWFKGLHDALKKQYRDPTGAVSPGTEARPGAQGRFVRLIGAKG